MKYFLGFFLLLLGSSSLCLADDTAMLSPNVVAATRPVVICQTFLAGSQDTTDGSNGWSLTSHGVAEKLFTVNQDGEIVPQVAESVTKVDENTWDVTIKADYKFSDGTDVDAQHVADALQELNDLNGSAKGSLGIMTVSVVDEDTVRIESERPTHVMDAVLAEWVFVVYKKTPEGDFIYTGPYAIDSFSDTEIELVPNRFYDGKSLERPLIALQKFPDGDALGDAAINGDCDVGFHLPIGKLPEVRDADGVRVKSFEVGYHYMMFHNTESLDIDVRKAIDTAIDRTVLSQALSGGTGTRSLFPDYSPYYFDESDPHGHSDDAAAILDAAGWTLNANGQREKDGEILTINLVAYPHRPGLGIMQPVIAETLEDLGMEVNVIMTGMDWDETATIMSERTFDLLMWAQHTLPAGDPLWFLSAFFRSDGGNNHAGLVSPEVDAKLDLLSNAEDHEARVALASDAQAEILSNVPVSNLVTPYWHVSVSDRMADYEPWGSDYYVIRADLFTTETTTDEVVEEDPVTETNGDEDHDDEDHEDSHDHNHSHDDHDDEDSSATAPSFKLGGSLMAILLVAAIRIV